MEINKPKFWDNKIGFLSLVLLPFTFFYIFLIYLKKKFTSTQTFNIPIICIGNIYIGGTGKTPLAREIFNITKSLNKKPAFIKKPYSYLNDEIKMLKETGKIFTSKNRAKSILLSIENNHDVVILDDGFQDFSIKTNLSIICFNSKQLIGNGLTIPSGPLRENFSSIKRADCIFINGSRDLDFEDKIKTVNSEIEIFYSNYRIRNLDNFKNKKVVAFAGIGNPENFFDLLKKNNINILKTISFPDHHNYSQKDYDELLEENEKEVCLLTTEKDYFRIDEKIKKKFYYIKVDLEIENKSKFIELIQSRL